MFSLCVANDSVSQRMVDIVCPYLVPKIVLQISCSIYKNLVSNILLHLRKSYNKYLVPPPKFFFHLQIPCLSHKYLFSTTNILFMLQISCYKKLTPTTTVAAALNPTIAVACKNTRKKNPSFFNFSAFLLQTGY